MYQKINPIINKKLILLLWIVAIVLTWDVQAFGQRVSEVYPYDDSQGPNWLIWLWFVIGSMIGIYNWSTTSDGEKVGYWLFAFGPLLIIIGSYLID